MRRSAQKTIILFCIPKQHAASYMQRQNITTRFLCIFIASVAQRIYVKEKNLLPKNMIILEIFVGFL